MPRISDLPAASALTGVEELAAVQTTTKGPTVDQIKDYVVEKDSTGWVANSDWTDAELVATHGLDTPLSDLIVKFFISTDGTEANAFEIINVTWAVNTIADTSYGHEIRAIDDDSFKIQTGASGLMHLSDAGIRETINSQSWYYKIVTYRLG